MLWFLLFFCMLAFFLLYIYAIRPFLEKVGVVKPLSEHAETVKGRFAAFCRSSFTILLGWLTTAAGSATLFSQQIVEWANGSDAKAAITDLLSKYPKTAMAVVGIVIPVLFILFRMRTAKDV